MLYIKRASMKRTNVSKVSIKSFKATCLCYDQKTITEAEAKRGRGQSHSLKKPILLFGIFQIHSIMPYTELF